MTTSKRFGAAVLLAATGVLLAACNTGLAGVDSGAREVRLPDGRTVVCVFDSGGGVDCDWANAKAAKS